MKNLTRYVSLLTLISVMCLLSTPAWSVNKEMVQLQASVDDLNMFSELAEARRIAPKVPARTLLRSATLTGAGALGFGDQFGSIEPGKRAALIAVRVPEGVSDVEEYLVSGIQPSAIQWLMSTPNSQIPTST